MAIAVYFHPKGMTLAQFAEIHRLLEEKGAGSPDGRLHHSCFGEDGHLMVFDIWESMEQFESFGTYLMPILAELGVTSSRPPDIMPVVALLQ